MRLCIFDMAYRIHQDTKKKKKKKKKKEKQSIDILIFVQAND